MPTVVSPEKAGNYTADELADLERQAGSMGTAIHTNDPPPRSTDAERIAFDTSLHDKSQDVIGRQFDNMTQAAIQGYAKSLIDAMAGEGDKFDPRYIAKRAAAQAEVEATLRASGVTLEAPVDPRLSELSRATGIPLSVVPHEIPVDWSRRPDLAPEVKTAALDFAVRIGAEPLIGKSLVERVVDLGLENSKWSPDQREKFIQRQGAQLTKMFGSKAAASDAITKAKQVLASAGGQFAADLGNSVVIHDAFFVTTLANVADAKATFEAARKRL